MSELTAKELPTKALNLEDLQEVLEMYNQVTQKLEVSHERLQQEVARLREQLEQKNKELELKKRLAALGEMAAGIAHEIRNPLGGIQLYASTLAAEVADRPLALELVKKISGGVRGLNSLVSDMLAFTQNIALSKQEQGLSEIVHSAVELATPALLENNVDVRIDESIEAATVCADGKLLRQVLLNLLLNAAEAMEGQAKDQKPESKNKKLEVGLIRILANTLPAGDAGGPSSARMQIVVEDNGPGIPAEAIEHIFNPFFTTKHKGTGLGLAIVHRIIEAHGGTITAENSPQAGARFTITLESSKEPQTFRP
ncbi:MAG: ATP-binding protein [Phycisphaerae bacterium]